MSIRSWLFVPADSERKLAKAPTAGADALVLDLEDAVAAGAKEAARAQAAGWLREQAAASGGPQRWVRINAVATQTWRDDLAAIVPAAPHGIVVPKVEAPAELELVEQALDAIGQRAGLAPRQIRIVPQLAESAQAALSLTRFAGPAPALKSLAAVSWGSEDLARAVGAQRRRGDDGRWTDLFRMVRSQLLLVAAARQVPAIETAHADFRDLEALARAAGAAALDGFCGMLAIHPAQVPVINAAFTPSEQQIARARAIVQAFAERPEAGALQLDGAMIELPHLAQARLLLARAGRAA